ncbi:hypothetical protein DFR50_10277 [Roseiarcus fermentans]|uniref:Integral membrane protein n=1 Tax=Roseiarcus fermentans TaxID=1473586 RepID=A0A366FV17_9HYPH|nr:hypothetical protein [Roseiarcus fermentans]RBP17585.1 hypothetical protein DFR50_10277 [Roseiarcus fermentans]
MNAPDLRRALRAAVVGVALLVSAAALAKTTGVVDDPALQTGPCYDALVDKNAATPTTAPNRELGSACEIEHGDVEKAWARVLRLWGSDSTDIPDYDSYRRADAPAGGAAPLWLAATGILLTYAVLGAPMRSAARLLGAYPGPAKGALIDVATSLVLRGLLLAAFVVLFSLPYLAAIGAAALIAFAAFRLGRPTPAPLDPSTDSLSAHLAEAINDPAGAAAGLAALALFVQHSVAAFAIGLGLAVVASAAPVILARRTLRATRVRAAVAAAALAAALGEAMVVAPPVSGWVGGLAGASLIVPVVLAGSALAAGFALAKPAVS